MNRSHMNESNGAILKRLDSLDTHVVKMTSKFEDLVKVTTIQAEMMKKMTDQEDRVRKLEEQTNKHSVVINSALKIHGLIAAGLVSSVFYLFKG
jgi:hypothetical protein